MEKPERDRAAGANRQPEYHWPASFSGLIDENRREQENLKRSELRTLQAQITPHFLYNTLDAIVWLAEAGRTEEVIPRLPRR